MKKPHPCGCKEFEKEHDIMDVWFDSGVSHTAVLDEYDELYAPCDLYLEGADQYRGWFQSSLLTSVVYKGCAPYKNVCTHGWVVDGQGKTMHKSLGNGIDPSEITDKYGADILRLWVASSDYHSDIRISKEILGQLSDAYKKIRNTARFILGNLSNGKGFNPDTDSVSDDQLTELDRWALMRLDQLIDKANAGYDAFDFHIVFHAIHNFCVVDMSSFYLDIIKDRLYCEAEDSVLRRAAQTTMYRVLSGLARLVAPIMSFTAEEIWSYLPHASSDQAESVFLNDMPQKSGLTFTADFAQKWSRIYELRLVANKALEEKRNEKLIGKSLEAKLTVACRFDEDYNMLSGMPEALRDICIVSDLHVIKDESLPTDTPFAVTVEKAVGDKCERCWAYSETVGTVPEHPTLCARCAGVVK